MFYVYTGDFRAEMNSTKIQTVALEVDSAT